MNLTLFALYTACVLPVVLAGAGGLFSKELCTCYLCTVYCVCITSGPGWSWGRILKRVMHMQPVYCVCIISGPGWNWGAYYQKNSTHTICVLCVYYQWAWLELGGVFSEDKPANLSLRKEGGRQFRISESGEKEDFYPFTIPPFRSGGGGGSENLARQNCFTVLTLNANSKKHITVPTVTVHILGFQNIYIKNLFPTTY